MAVRAKFYDGPLDGKWKALQEVVKEIYVAKPVDVNLCIANKELEDVELRRVRGLYLKVGDRRTPFEDTVTAYYVWQGWEDELQEVQKDEGARDE